jgi:hypothetical protein
VVVIAAMMASSGRPIRVAARTLTPISTGSAQT